MSGDGRTTAPIFIGGLMRSGTTLLRVLVARHSAIFGGLETFWFDPEALARWREPDGPRQRLLREFFEVGAADFERLKAGRADGVAFFDAFMDFCAHRAGRRRWVEKTPDNVLHLDLIRRHWPDATFLHVRRDLRDVYASWKLNKKASLAGFIEKVHAVQAAVGPLAGRRTDFYMEVAYGALTAEPARTMREVCAHVGETFEPAMTEYPGDDVEYTKVKQATGKESTTLRSLTRPIFRDSVGQWRQVLAPDEVATLERELAPHLAEQVG